MNLLTKRELPPETTVELLLECHGRIRRFTKLALELVKAEAPDEQLADAARSLCAYFGRAFQLHAQDEDFSIRPRLDAAGRLAAEMRAIASQHDHMHEVLDGLLLRWSSIAETPSQRDAFRDRLGADTQKLAELIEAHLALEEERIFPVLREVLTPEQDREIIREMRARRA